MDPGDAFRRFAGEPGLVFFDSGGAPGERSRYSYLCLDPFRMLLVQDGIVSIDGDAVDDDAFSVLARELARHATAPRLGAPPFRAGATGFIGYDMGAALDRAPRAPGAFAGIPDMQFGFYHTVLAFDHTARTVWLFAPAGAPRDAILARLARDAPWVPPPHPLSWRIAVPRDVHVERVQLARDFIAAGDIYQANIAASFEAARPVGLCPTALFLAVRAASPAPFGAYVDCGDECAVLSASPERFIRLTPSGDIETRPIKGTRKRGADAADDAVLAAELLSSAKDRAENLMIVDLLRNDIARVADRVTVPSLHALESFAHVHHLVSTVRGRLVPGFGAVDLLRATFPGGSVTGAPKLRAMAIIAELEGRARGPYCGAAAWIGFDGAMDSNILIRTLTVARDRVVAQAGGGIVADSDPAAEWDEVLVKILPLLRATGTV
jgi:para-aminobenzoate synthetase component 1